jgi:hypothetical protein
MKKLLLFALLGMCFPSLRAQNLLIRYDFLKDDYTFYRVKPGKPPELIEKPVVGRNNTVKVEIVNFNKFVYAAKCTFEAGESDESSQVNFMSLLTPLVVPQSGASFLSQFGGGNANEENARNGSLFKDRLADQSYLAAQTSYKSLYEVERTLKNIDFSISKLQELKYNKYLPSDSIKKMASLLVTKAIKSENASHADFMNTIESLNNAYMTHLSSFKLSSEDFEGAFNRLSSSRGETTAKNPIKRLSDEVTKMEEFYDDDFISVKVNLLENMYESIINTEFRFNASDLAEKDFLDIKLDMYEYPTDDEGLPKAVSQTELEDLVMVKNKKLKVTVKGDLKINSSLGLAFPYYANNFGYINVGGEIVEQPGNNFAPNISAFMNFYPYNGKLGQLGGTFGLGLPIAGDDRNLSVFLGGASLFGSKNRIVLNAGASLGQVTQLDMGLQNGEMLDNEFMDVPTRQVWQWGAFLGISFSVADVVN